MADEKKIPDVEQETTKPEPDRQKQLPEKDLDKVSGGTWIDVHQV